MNAIEIQVHHNGRDEVSKVYTARDTAHADRLIARLKAQLAAGSSTYFARRPLV